MILLSKKYMFYCYSRKILKSNTVLNSSIAQEALVRGYGQ
ncbi:hypothetical protein HMPREF0322_02446 [Desulfitobacterium hafniense DP7]|uniref:Uncharacterized protein n=1 Tax=Desulfitobacterium hafniense DP7 TaxID=537010 RepID=G9XNA5_DESHA|nr:hypothetical protein HMPREF0322_02446 [Desulfitobacterium hafniense DP7]